MAHMLLSMQIFLAQSMWYKACPLIIQNNYYDNFLTGDNQSKILQIKHTSFQDKKKISFFSFFYQTILIYYNVNRAKIDKETQALFFPFMTGRITTHMLVGRQIAMVRTTCYYGFLN